MRNVGRISGLKLGDRVRTIADIRNGAWANQLLPAGASATLGCFYRIDKDSNGEQVECWEIWVGEWPNKRSWACCHTQIEKVIE
jgi:hypothetical protein